VVLGIGFATIPEDGAAHDPVSRVLEFSVSRPRTVVLVFPAGADVRRNDPVLATHPVRYLDAIGVVRDVRVEAGRRVAVLTIFPESDELLRGGATFTLHRAGTGAAWVAKTLLPPERMAAIVGMTREFIRREGKQIADALWPQVRLGLLDLVALYEKQLPAAIVKRKDRIDALLARHREGVIREVLVPAIQEVVVVKAKEAYRPMLERLGKDLWKKLPVWSLGARAVWQEVPGTKDDQVKERFEKYLTKEVQPLVKQYGPEAAKIAREVLKASMKDPRLQAALREVVAVIGADPETNAILKELLGELVVDNERLREVLKNRWEEGLGEAVEQASRRLEPLIRTVVNAVTMNESRDAINPRLARVLRARVMKKDARWILLEGGDGEPFGDDVELAGSVANE
jgi:hypothetical protein